MENEAGVALRVITSDNDPPDGFRLEPEGSSIITKEVSSPSDMSIHAVVPGEEKTLLLNGQPRVVVAPSKAIGDPMVFKITGKDGKTGYCSFAFMLSKYFDSVQHSNTNEKTYWYPKAKSNARERFIQNSFPWLESFTVYVVEVGHNGVSRCLNLITDSIKMQQSMRENVSVFSRIKDPVGNLAVCCCFCRHYINTLCKGCSVVSL